MIDPVIFSFDLFGLTITLRWYGVLVMIGAIVGAWIVERELRRRGENGESIWDAMIWVLPAGIIGARLWFVINATLGGSRYYVDNPIKILAIPEGGLHIFGGFLLGAIVLLIYLHQNKKDTWLFMDAIAPAALIGQAVARPANFINQELYGPPTSLPWGIPIEAAHRLPQYADLGQYPLDTTRFHPTFAYEMIWNFLAALLLIWLSRQYKDKMKPGAVFGGWLVLAGLGRAWIEFFRPDQPRIPGTFITFTMIIALLMGLTGIVFLLIRYRIWTPAFAEGWEEKYQVSRTVKPASAPAQTKATEAQRKPAPRAAAAPAAKKAVKKAVKKAAARKAPAKKAVKKSPSRAGKKTSARKTSR